jgi:hypothetical protein
MTNGCEPGLPLPLRPKAGLAKPAGYLSAPEKRAGRNSAFLMYILRNGALSREMPSSGVYLFTESGRHLYVGRSNDLRGRYGRHCRPGATHRQAAFALQLAREKTGQQEPSYRIEGSRNWLIEQPAFRAAFEEAKERIRAMEYRYAEEDNQNRQALLEIYCAVVALQ